MEKVEPPLSQPQTGAPKDEVVETYGDHKKKRHGGCSCLMLFFVILLLIAGFLTWQTAATGLVNIPLVSTFAYKETEPTRIVKAGTRAEERSESFFKATLAKRLQAGAGELQDRSVTLSLPESSLTASLQNVLTKSKIDLLDASRAQIVVLSGHLLEVFVPVRVGNQTSSLLMTISLTADNGVFDLGLKEVKLGAFRAPSMMVAFLVQPFVNRQLSSLNQALSSYMHVDALETQDGGLDVSGTFTVEIKK